MTETNTNTCKECGGVLVYGNPAANDDDAIKYENWFDLFPAQEYEEAGNSIIGRLLNARAWAEERGYLRHSSYKARFGMWLAQQPKRGESRKWRENENFKKRRGKWRIWSDYFDDKIPF